MTTFSVFNGAAQRLSELQAALPEIHVPEITGGHIGFGLAMLGTGMLAAYAERYWLPAWKTKRAAKAFAKSEAKRKAMRLREAMDKREARLREMLAEILVDGILDRQVLNELSDQEGKKLYKLVSEKLDIPDLVPRQTRFDIVKAEIRSRFHLGYYKRNAGELDAILKQRLAKTPPPLPKEVVETAYSTSKYWKPKTVAA